MSLSQAPQWSVGAHQVVLTHDLIERARPQQFGQGCRFAQALIDGVVKE
jgi:hypothetical protein